MPAAHIHFEDRDYFLSQETDEMAIPFREGLATGDERRGSGKLLL